MGMSDFPEMYAQRPRAGLQAYISGKSRVPMLQLICITSIKTDGLNANTSGITGFVINYMHV